MMWAKRSGAMWVLILLFAPVFVYSALESKKHPITLDVQGEYGIVFFDHAKHEAYINPDPNNPHKPATATVACTGCHHTVKDVTQREQFQKCTTCHKMEGDPANLEDREGYELNTREVFHRSCIGCHVASNIKASNKFVTNASFTKCKECHVQEATYAPVAITTDQQLIESAPKMKEPAPVPVHETPAETALNRPLGATGSSNISGPEQIMPDFMPVPDRWRIGFPDDPRYKKGRKLNPYGQNFLKGDFPLFGQHTFLVLTLENDTFTNFRNLPVPSDISSQDPDSSEFFGRGEQFFTKPNFVASVEIFHGDTAYKPVDWRVRVTPNFNVNYLYTRENGIVDIDVRRGNTRTDGYITLQEAFGEIRLGDTTKIFPFLPDRNEDGSSPYYDTTFIRAGIQPFISDFRGFLFYDVNLGARLFGNYGNNRYQFNATYFDLLEKDTNSELNTREFRDQRVFIANLFRQDTFKKGYTLQFSYHYNRDEPTIHFDTNGFLVRPAPVGDAAPHEITTHYLGWASDGHLGRLNISHAFYQAFGEDTRNPIAGQAVDINAQMAALELSIDKDWMRFKGSVFWASGDSDPFDDQARGFDAILDFPEFAGGKFSFWNSQGIRLTQTGVALVHPDSLLPSLRTNKLEGQANFVNPGLFLYNLGYDADLTPKLKAILNLNYLRFHHVQPLEELLFQPGISKDIGFDYGIGFIYRPFLTENMILAAGFSGLIPGGAFTDIYSSNCEGQFCGADKEQLYSVFVKVRLTY